MADDLPLTIVIMLNRDAPLNLSLMFFVQVKAPPPGLSISLKLCGAATAFRRCIFWQGTADEGARDERPKQQRPGVPAAPY